MSNPLSFLPYALSAGGGRVDGVPAAAHAAAGFTLLQRSAALVRALAGKRSAILLPPSGGVLTALAASDGRGAVLLAGGATRATIERQLAEANVGAVFTTRALAARLPAGAHATVLLDDAPRAATVVFGGADTPVDLGSHFGLDLEGEEDDGSDEECLIAPGDAADAHAPLPVFSHRALLALARGAVDAASLLKSDRVLAMLPPSHLAGFSFTFAGPLLAGAEVMTVQRFAADETVRRIEADGTTILAGDVAMFSALAEALEAHGRALAAPDLRVCACLAADLPAALQQRWLQLTGVELRQAFGVAEAPLALFNAPHFPNRPGALGVPFPGMQASVRDPRTGDLVPRGTPGALWLRGAPLCGGYVRHPNDSLPRRDGWLQTREQVCERADGAFERAR